MLKLLQPGIEPLGQFDLEDEDASLVVGGEVAVLEALTVTDAYAADVGKEGPQLQLTLDQVSAHGVLYGLVDEGTSGYGTLFGTVIGATTGQGTGLGTQSAKGTVVVGPSTTRGSGKATLWTKPGLYGVTVDAWADSAEFDALTLNAALFGTAADGADDGKLTTSPSGNGVAVALGLGLSTDDSLVSTTSSAAGAGLDDSEYAVVYLLGVQAAV